MSQLTVVRDLGSTWEWCLAQDPVRPHIPFWKRVASNREYFLLNEGMDVHAVTCVAYLDAIPTTEDDLFQDATKMSVACFYTVWSNQLKPGAGRKVINKTLDHIKITRPFITRKACTLSPKTTMAKNFHLTNGATLYRENELTDNYMYDISRP